MLALGIFASKGNDNGRHNIATYACSAILLLAIFIETSSAIMEELSPGKSSLFFPFHRYFAYYCYNYYWHRQTWPATAERSTMPLASFTYFSPAQGKLDFAAIAAVVGLPPNIAQRVRHHFKHLQVAERINERKNCC